MNLSYPSHEEEVKKNILNISLDKEFKDLSLNWLLNSAKHRYSYNFNWLGRPIIQYPQDIVVLQEIIWSIRPDLIVETGIAHGGSLVMSASMLALLDLTDAISKGSMLDPKSSKRKVVGVDIDIRPHNKAALEAHQLYSYMHLIQGSSIDPKVAQTVKDYTKGYEKVLVILDSNHTHDHVLAELNAYADLVSIGAYCIVFDTVVEDMPKSFFLDRNWGPGNNPKTAVHEFLKDHSEFEIDKSIENKLLITVAPDGFLKRIC